MSFTDIVKQDTPRLVVMFKREGDDEMFQWGIVGVMPILTLVGCITRIQSDLHFRAAEECDQPALVVAWDDKAREFSWFLHPIVPLESLVGMLEVIKVTLIGSQLARQAAAQQIEILGPDGSPMRRRI